jgi:hypothetical protein
VPSNKITRADDRALTEPKGQGGPTWTPTRLRIGILSALRELAEQGLRWSADKGRTGPWSLFRGLIVKGIDRHDTR